jgi:ubiquitin-protein ligase
MINSKPMNKLKLKLKNPTPIIDIQSDIQTDIQSDIKTDIKTSKLKNKVKIIIENNTNTGVNINIADPFPEFKPSWLKHRHIESLKLIKDSLPEPYYKLDELDIFTYLDKEGIISHACIDNFVIRNLLYYPDKVYLLLDMVDSAVTNDETSTTRKVYKPTPNLLFGVVESCIKKLIRKLKENSFNFNMTDMDILNIIDFDCYKLLKFTLYQTQHIDIKPSPLISCTELEKKLNKQSPPMHHMMNTDAINSVVNFGTHLYEIIYLNDNRVMDTKFVFHGSPFMNWYSILNNGLYVPEKHQILHGSSQGVGIYLAENASISLGYMQGNVKKKGIIGIAQLNNHEQYSKGGHVYVATKSEDVRLKYLIVFDTSHTPLNLVSYQAQYLTEKLTQFKYATQNKLDNIITNKIALKRIKAELKHIQELKIIYGFPIDVTCDVRDITVWTIKIDTPTNKWGTMKWEIRFDHEHPIKPPFVRIISPQFKYRSGHITIGGAFCSPMLTNQGWRASISIDNLIETLMVNMEEGGAEIDKTNSGNYNLQEAQTAYNRYKVTHGWN